MWKHNVYDIFRISSFISSNSSSPGTVAHKYWWVWKPYNHRAAQLSPHCIPLCIRERFMVITKMAMFVACIALGYEHYTLCNDVSQLVTSGWKLNSCEGVSRNNPSFQWWPLRISTLPKFLFTIFCRFLCPRAKNSLSLLGLSTRNCQFPYIYHTVVSPYNITAASLTLCTVTASFSTLCTFLCVSVPCNMPPCGMHPMLTWVLRMSWHTHPCFYFSTGWVFHAATWLGAPSLHLYWF